MGQWRDSDGVGRVLGEQQGARALGIQQGLVGCGPRGLNRPSRKGTKVSRNNWPGEGRSSSWNSLQWGDK